VKPELLLSMLFILVFAVSALFAAPGAGEHSALRPVPFNQVHVSDAFWAARLRTNREVTVPYDFEKCEETGRIRNFAVAGGLVEGDFEGIYFNDSDVYKVIEGAAYALADHPDPKLDAYLDDLIAKIAAAQEEDGYLNTFYTITAPDEKWTNIAVRHELYCAGHLMEAAVAHYQATGKRSLLDVALRLADHIDAVFGPGRRTHPPGHQEIEIGLMRLYHLTGEERYYTLARFFIDQRGHANDRELYGRYSQDHIPVIEQSTPVGHAVRAMYLYCGMADVAAVDGDQDYLDALDRIWSNMVERKLYLTGGIGARHQGEAFGDDYELPNATAYNETCAAIGNALWNHRMNLLHADAKYADVLERIIYNGFLSGISLSGDRFFYPNPLESHGGYARSPWFSCSCCPVNVVRFVPSIPGYIYARTDDTVYVNLYIASEATVDFGAAPVALTQATDYPWDGSITLTVNPSLVGHTFDLALRIPGWVRDEPTPGGLYHYIDDRAPGYTVHVNGAPVTAALDRGYLHIRRAWRPQDEVTIDFDMPVRRVAADDQVEADRGRVAVERGPIVYCLEAVDTTASIPSLWLPRRARLTPTHDPDLLGGVTVINASGIEAVRESDSGDIVRRPVSFRMVPYYAWNHRGPVAMSVWLAASEDAVEIAPPPTIASRAVASASHCFSHDAVTAINDLKEPAGSGDHDIPRHTWWGHKGTTEWVQLDLAEEATIEGVSVYWFDDTGRGECRVPASWSLQCRVGDDWVDVEPTSPFGVELDTDNEVTFAPITTTAVRIIANLQDGYSGGVLEVKLHPADDS
jgi:DUF1680 family protein